MGWLASGMTRSEIISDFPEITEEDISACLSYAAERERKIRVKQWNELFRLKIVVHFYFSTIYAIAIIALFVVVNFPA